MSDGHHPIRRYDETAARLGLSARLRPGRPKMPEPQSHPLHAEAEHDTNQIQLLSNCGAFAALSCTWDCMGIPVLKPCSAVGPEVFLDPLALVSDFASINVCSAQWISIRPGSSHTGARRNTVMAPGCSGWGVT